MGIYISRNFYNLVAIEFSTPLIKSTQQLYPMFIHQLALIEISTYKATIIRMVLKLCSGQQSEIDKYLKMARNEFYKTHQLSDENPIAHIYNQIIVPLFGNQFSELIKPYIYTEPLSNVRRKLNYEIAPSKLQLPSKLAIRQTDGVKNKISSLYLSHIPKFQMKKKEQVNKCPSILLDKLKRATSCMPVHKVEERKNDNSEASSSFKTPTKVRALQPMPSERILAFNTPSKD
jgi:hypothetical protein